MNTNFSVPTTRAAEAATGGAILGIAIAVYMLVAGWYTGKVAESSGAGVP